MNRPISSPTSSRDRYGRFRRGLSDYLVPMLIWGGIGMAGSFLAIKIVDRSLAPVPTVNPEKRWPELPAALRGKQIEVPGGAGFWVSRDPQAEVLIHRANVSGAKREINLCQQLKNPPSELFPITLVGAWEDVQSARKSGKLPVQRSPLVVAPEMAAAMPRLIVRGSYRGVLTAEVIPGPQTGRWELAFAENRGKSFVLSDESWLLWQSTLASKGPGNFSHAIRIRRQPDQPIADNANCGEVTEKLEWQLYTAHPAPGAEPLSEKADVVIRAAGANSAVHLQLSTGEHMVPLLRAPQMEDKVLFDRAYARGLIREGANGLAEWVPADLPRADRDLMPAWAKVNLSDPESKSLHKALYRSANGAFVRDQLQHFNACQQWLAVRVRTAGNSQAWGDLRRWKAQADNQALNLSNDLPYVSARLFDRLPVGWSDWVRVVSWPMTAGSGATPSVSMVMTSPEGSRSGQRIELLVLGQLLSVSGGQIISSQPACRVAACPAPDLLTLATIELGKGPLELHLQTDARFNRLRPEASDGTRVRLRQGKLAWREDVGGGNFASNGAPLEVTLLARDATPLFAEGRVTDKASSIGLAELLGFGMRHETGLAGMLGRLGAHGYSHAAATLSIDTQWQAAADQVLDCVGLRQGEWNAATRQCIVSEKADETIPERRIASLVVVDAENGGILAAAGGPHAPADVTPADLIAFDRFNPGASRLRVHAWQHDGGKRYSPGSTFKLVDALALEHWAAGRPERQAQLAGRSLEEWNAMGKSSGFIVQAGCYPSPCSGNRISNFEGKPASNAAHNRRLGLAEALEKSVNTWFAWMVERSDATAPVAPKTQALGRGGLEEARPVLAMAHRLGFEQRQRLDGGLLPDDFAWQADDHLQTVASRFDRIDDVHNIRLQAIGQRMQATPLQMAEVAAAIATGKTVSPRLLLDLNGVAAKSVEASNLGVELTRIRQGMKAVVETGTAASAFAGGRAAFLRHQVFGKTGTANMENHAGEKKAGVKGDSNQVVWFVGYLQAGSLPDQPHALAFAVSISHSSLTGGGHAARVMAALLGSMVPATWT